MSETTQTTPAPVAPTTPPAPEPAPAPPAAPVSFLARWRADVEAAAQAIGVDVEKLWALIKEHM